MNYEAVARWALGSSTGASAECIAQHMIGMKPRGSWPHDSGDFGRCEALLDAIPEFRERLPEMASINRYWAALIPRWEDIRRAEDKYALIRSILQPVERGDSSHIEIGPGVSLRFGAAT